MRSLNRNKQKIYYSLYSSKTPILDEYGNQTGEYETTYATPVALDINVSAARGTSDVEQFGINLNYTKSMVTNDLTCPIDETSRLWVNKYPFVLDDNNNVVSITPHNYVVVSVAKSINSITYAIKEVSVT